MFPKLLVTKEIALLIRNVIVEYFKNTFYSNDLINWENIIDDTVYKQNGLRMLGSSKIEKCSCKYKKEIDCIDCNGTKKCDSNRYYVGKYIINNNSIKYIEYKSKSKYLNHYENIININEFTDKLKERFVRFQSEIDDKEFNNINYFLEKLNIEKKIYNFRKIIEISSIKTFTNFCYNLKEEGHPFWVREVICNKLNEYTPPNSVTPILTPSQKVFVSNLKKNSDFKSNVVKEIYSVDTEIGITIINYIKHLFPIYQNEIFKEILYMGNYYTVSTNSRYCMNVEREHSGNHIYFVIDQQKIYQKCFSTKISSDQKYGSCKDFCSHSKPLNRHFKNILYKVIKSVSPININKKEFSKKQKKIKKEKKIDLNCEGSTFNKNKIKSLLFQFEEKFIKY